MKFGWKSKVDKLKMIVLSAGHQVAKELAPGIARMLDLYHRAATTLDASTLAADMDALPTIDDQQKPLWEPMRVAGWNLQLTFYRKDDALWLLLHASLPAARAPSENEISMLERIVERLGALPDRHWIITPRTVPVGEPALPFGWWTWKNFDPLYEVQVNKSKKGTAMMRIVPNGSRETDGYVSLNKDLAKEPAKKDPP